MDNAQHMLEEFDIKQFEEISGLYGELFDWFDEQYPESSIRLDVDNDKRLGTLNYKLTVLTGKEMADNQRSFYNTIVMTKKNFLDPTWMAKFKSMLVPTYKKYISQEINKHYHVEKEKTN